MLGNRIRQVNGSISILSRTCVCRRRSRSLLRCTSHHLLPRYTNPAYCAFPEPSFLWVLSPLTTVVLEQGHPVNKPRPKTALCSPWMKLCQDHFKHVYCFPHHTWATRAHDKPFSQPPLCIPLFECSLSRTKPIFFQFKTQIQQGAY